MLRSMLCRAGCAALVASAVLLSGCSTDAAPVNSATNVSRATLATGGAANVYAINYTSSTANVLLVTNVSTGASTSLGLPVNFYSEAVAADATNAILYLGGFTYSSTGYTYEVLAYPAASTTLATPTRTLVSNGSFTDVDAMSVDAAGQLYVLSAAGVAVYAAAANGTVAPARTIAGSSTGIANELSLAVDTAGSVYVSTQDTYTSSSVKVFAANANGNVTPVRTVTYNNGLVYGIAVDSSLNLYAAEETVSSNSASNVQIAVYSANATGAATPAKTITGTGTKLTYIGGLSMDKANNVYALNDNYNAGTFQLLGFGPSATGNMAPGFNVTPSALDNPQAAIAVY